MKLHPRHHYHSPWKRALYSLTLLALVLSVGTVGFHWIEGSSYLDAFYLTSMIARPRGRLRPP